MKWPSKTSWDSGLCSLSLFALRDHEMSTNHLSPHDALSRGQSNEAKGSWTSVSKTTRQTKTTNTKKLTLQLKKKALYLLACVCTCLHGFMYTKYMQVSKEARRGYRTSRNVSLRLWGLLTKSVSSPGALSTHNH